MEVIYYFSRSGRSEFVANELSKRRNAQVFKIDDHRDWSGFKGMFWGGYHATFKIGIPIEYRKPQDDEEIILVFPVWASALPPAVRTFCKEISKARITAVVTSSGSLLKERKGFKKVVDLVKEDAEIVDF
jgi:flavodoxin